MFMHAGSRPLWPVVVFLPWLAFGVWSLLLAATHKLGVSSTQALSRARRPHAISLWAIPLLAATQLVLADPVIPDSRPCDAASPQEARTLADRLYERGEYQRAGVCYQAAGDLPHANLAFLKAAGPTSADTARELKAQRDTAKALFAGVAQALRGNH